MYDPKHFPGPHYLKPERFLDDNGRHKHHDHVIPFRVGKRYCPGQTLAEKEFLVGMLLQFHISSTPMQNLPSYRID